MRVFPIFWNKFFIVTSISKSTREPEKLAFIIPIKAWEFNISIFNFGHSTTNIFIPIFYITINLQYI